MKTVVRHFPCLSFQDCLMEWISTKSDCHAHMLINHLLYVTMTCFKRQFIVHKQNTKLSFRIVPIKIMHI